MLLAEEGEARKKKRETETKRQEVGRDGKQFAEKAQGEGDGNRVEVYQRDNSLSRHVAWVSRHRAIPYIWVQTKLGLMRLAGVTGTHPPIACPETSIIIEVLQRQVACHLLLR